MSAITNDVQNRNQSVDLETFYPQKTEPEQTQKKQPARSGFSDTQMQQTIDSLPDPHIDYSSLTQAGNSAGAPALAQQAGKTHQAEGTAQATSVDFDMKNVHPGTTFVLKPSRDTDQHKPGSPYRASTFMVSKNNPIERHSLPPRIPEKFSQGKGPIYQVDVSFPGSETNPTVRKQDTWYYNEGSKQWGFLNDKSQFQTSHVGPYNRVIEGIIPPPNPEIIHEF
jgi:hypothetical protein